MGDVSTAIVTAIRGSRGDSGSPALAYASGSDSCIKSVCKIELQETLLKQIEFLHRMYESGPITDSQFEVRMESIMKQLDVMITL